ncbi:methyl-accepting chemotaxis protein [Paenibacillus sp. YPG26]|uniref:methyl-accepting chemotaxis protein n=1 Tax=unclassified Paenibacillus TaxID=185978 RepID=UPI00203A8B7B|nr:methyl-accepting chemotaxis protein [Paenibacillus sp. YPG26]USB33910.1 methyl-accepting chemotaxis protein [Paenibacillus sp. YPG26]
MRLNKLKIGTKFNLLVIGIVVFLSIVISLTAKYQIEKAMLDVFTSRVKIVSALGYSWLNTTYPGDWSVKGGELYKGSTKINNNNEIPDQIGKITNGAVTIFLGDTRIATNVMNKGQRQIGTKADPQVTDTVLKTGQTYLGKANVVGTEHLTLYKPIKDRDGTVIGMWLVGPKLQVINETVLSLMIMFAVTLVIVAAIAVVLSILFTRSMVRPILTINKQLNEIAEGEGDLTKELQVKSQDEIGDLATSFNKMLGNLRRMIGQIGTISEQVAASSEELTASAAQTTQATNQITTSIQEVAGGADTQGQGAIESSTAMNEMAVGIQHVAETTSSVTELAMATSREASSGHESLRQVINQMSSIDEAVHNSASVVRDLREHAEEIGKITEVITSIANQTNLLALNAAIESARAGEHGKGFAVVANEVRKLAEQSRDSANQITGLINKIQRDTSLAVDVMDKGTQEVKQGVDVVHVAEIGFNKILQLIEQVADQIQEASAVSQEMSASAEQVSASIDEIAHIAQNSATNIQNVASASEEQLASMEEISAASSALSKMAEELQAQVGQFKTEK